MNGPLCRCHLKLRLAPPDEPYPEPPPGRMSPFCYACWKADEVVPLFPVRRPRKGLGDAVATTLKAVGVTPERVAKITGKPCNCRSRQAKLNRWGWRAWDRVMKLFGRR